MKKPYCFIGLTGGIASGKSTVASMLRQLGAVLIDADLIAREATLPGTETLKSICRHFGPGILNPDGSLRRDSVGQIVFARPEEKKWLEDLLHPLIRRKAEEKAEEAFAAGHHIVIFDVPLLFESGWNEWMDAVWTVYVTPEMQKERLRARDGFSDEEISARLAAQWPIDQKIGKSDVVIDNTGTVENTRQQVEKAWSTLLKNVCNKSRGELC